MDEIISNLKTPVECIQFVEKYLELYNTPQNLDHWLS